MTTYNFSQISDFEFEELCRDLLQEKLGLSLELFAPGPDGGIDIRHIGVSDGEQRVLVAQCKRWDEGAYSSLLGRLKRDELPKIKRLNPGRYILMTSVRLTPGRKDEIVKALKPWIRNPSDIYGRDDLSGLLQRYPEVEHRHIKLWLTSAEVLKALLNSDVVTRTEGAIERAQRQLRLWVPNPSLDRARKVLEDTHVCIISGAPGIGKTMLSDVLRAAYASLGFEPVVISEDIGEGDRVWSASRKQVFHYDDFLGHVTYGELQLRKNEESRLADFVERVRRSENKRFILTTREYILAEALNRYERFSSSGIDRHKSIVELQDYSLKIRARILYNHIFFSSLPHELKSSVVYGKKYLEVIRNRNYSPRLIDHAINVVDTSDFTPQDFTHSLLSVLEDPSEVWGKIFGNLSKMARRVLLVVASLPSEVLLEDVRIVVQGLSKDDFEPAEFKSAIDMVEGTFLDLTEARPGRGRRERIVTIRDPSVHDYLWGRLEAVDGEAERLLDAAVFFEQCVVLYEGSTHAAQASGQGEKRDPRRRIVVDHEAVASRSVELIASSNPRLIRATGAGSDYLTRDRPNQERRAAFVTRVLADHRGSRTVAGAAASALEAARARWDGGLGSASEGMNLLRQAGAVQNLLPEGVLQGAEHAFLSLITGRLEETDDFSALVDLAEWDPHLFEEPHRGIGSWQSEFQDFLEEEEDWLLRRLDDPDLIEQELFELSRIADALGADLYQLAIDTEGRITELRDALYEYDDDDDDWRDWRSESRATSEEREINDLFQSLL